LLGAAKFNNLDAKKQARLSNGQTLTVNIPKKNRGTGGTITIRKPDDCTAILSLTANVEYVSSMWFDLNRWTLPANRYFFSYQQVGISGQNETFYGYIPAAQRPDWWPN